MMLRYITLATALLSVVSCSKPLEDYPEEDYAKLFPFKGIEKPETDYNELVVRPCDPSLALEEYRYPGVAITKDVRTYTITLKCKFTERINTLSLGSNPTIEELANAVTSRYVVRYIAADKTLQEIRTSPRSEGVKMTNGVEYTLSFTAYSGYPMYLSVNGLGPRDSRITASIEAVSDDGLTVVNPLTTTQVQQTEGIDRLPNPFCSYVILP